MSVQFSDRVLAGGPGDFMTVRHLRLQGTQYEIGTSLAEFARDELGVRKLPWTDPLMTRAQRCFMKKNWPEHYARMRGAAAAFQCDPDDDRLDFSFLSYDSGIPGCSCVYYPGPRTADGHSVLSRNFDYTLGGAADLPWADGVFKSEVGKFGGDENRPYVGRPFLLETYPDEGYAVLGMCAFDLLGMLTDGINSEGLAVALLNDGETINSPLCEPFGSNGVGISEGCVPRFVLETCANADEALLTLLTTKQYYASGPCHYLIGDRHGRGFVWEYSSIRNRHHIIECGEKPLAVTNHLLYPHQIPNEEDRADSLRRLRELNARLDESAEQFTRQRIGEINRCVEATQPIGQGQYVSATHPTRTLWQAQYDLDARAVDIDFFLGEDEQGIRRSPRFSLQLGNARP
ncbi:MAG: C45 family autoproteolytic acyltransferase/hydrolase [Proteobacteria bacterium]|nr:C45 family autoproteolytic acyltransferase/hydrolase [Pseudomonadota bacterium]